MRAARTNALVSAVLASLWTGATIFLAAVLAPAAFRVLPTRALAGAIVGATLPALLIAGLVLGAVIIALALPAREIARRGRMGSGAFLLIACATAQFVIGGRIERVRSAIAVPIESLPVTDPRREEFARLHAFSVGALGVATLAAMAAGMLAVLSLRERDVHPDHPVDLID